MPSSQVLAAFNLDARRIEPTRAGDEGSIGNGNWKATTADGELVILRRYHVLATPDGLDYEGKVLDHLTARGWTVPQTLSGPVTIDDRLWALTRYVPGKPHASETSQQREQRGRIMARLHNDLEDLDLGQRPGFFPAADLDAMGEYQRWDPGLHQLRRRDRDLAARAAAAMKQTKDLVSTHQLLDLPQTIIHGDLAEWNLHFDERGRLAGIIDFALCHPDSRAWEFVIARVHRSPELLTGYRETVRTPLSDPELAAIEPLQAVLRVLMVMALLWDGQQSGRFDLAEIATQLAKDEGCTE